MGILDPSYPRALSFVVLQYVGTKFEPTQRKIPDKRQDHQSSHQTIKYHQYVVGISQVPPAVLLTSG